MQDVAYGTREGRTQKVNTNMILQLIRRGETSERIASLLHVPETAVDSMMETYVMKKLF